MILKVTRLKQKGPHGHPMIRVRGEGGPDDVHVVEVEFPDAYIAELQGVAAEDGDTIEIEDES